MRVLILSPYFAPENSVASIRFTKIAKYLLQKGLKVDVIRTDMSANSKIDPMLERDLEWINNVYTVNYPNIYYNIANINAGGDVEAKEGLFARFYKWARKGKFYEKFAHYAAFKRYELPLAKSYVKKMRELVEVHGMYDCIVTTFSPLSSIIAGEQAKKAGYCKKWILDYRDHVGSFKERSFFTKKMIRISKKANKLADIITTVSEGMKERIAEGDEQILQKTHVITNGADMQEREYIKDVPAAPELSFVFAGSLYAVGEDVNSPGPLFAAIGELLEEGAINSQNIKICYAGSSSDAFAECIKRYGLGGCYRDYGYVTREKVYEIYAGSDIFLLCVWNNSYSKGIITGKFFESLVLKMPVLAVVVGEEKDSELARIVREKNIGFAYEQAEKDEERLKEWLLVCYNEKLAKGRVSYEPRDVYEYTHEALADKFAELMMDGVNERRAD